MTDWADHVGKKAVKALYAEGYYIITREDLKAALQSEGATEMLRLLTTERFKSIHHRLSDSFAYTLAAVLLDETPKR